MTTDAISKPLRTLQKMRGRSLDELRTRGVQLISAYRERLLSIEAGDTDAFLRYLDPKDLAGRPVDARSVSEAFYENAAERFFPSISERASYLFSSIAGEDRSQWIIDKADAVIDGYVDLLGHKRVFIGNRGPVDWHREPISGVVSPLKHWKEFDDLDQSESGDKKIVWELNRHQHFFILGAAYRLTADEKYADRFVEHLVSWIAQDPPGLGINWVSSLEVAFRAMSWLWALNLFRDSAAMTPELVTETLRVLFLHGRHIEKYLSLYFSPNTHLTGEALGLYYLGTQLPFINRAKRWRERGEEMLLEEASKQFHSDGVYFEHSTWYQRYSTDFYLHFLTLRERAGGAEYDPRNLLLDERVNAALNFMMHVTRPDGTTPLIGDDDGGRMLPLTSARPDDMRATLAVGGALLGRGDLMFAADGEIEQAFWLLGPDRARSAARMDAQPPNVSSRGFEEGGYFAMRNGWDATDDHIVIDCGDLGALSGGHGHADALAIDLSLRGERILIDSGTFAYAAAARTRDAFRSSAFHNTVTIDERSSSTPAGVFSWSERSEVVERRFFTTDVFDHFSGTIRTAGGHLHERAVFYLRGDYVVIRDRVTAVGEHAHDLHFNYDPARSPEISGDGKFIADASSGLFVFGPEGAFKIKNGWSSTNFGSREASKHVTYSATAVDHAEYFTFVLPSDGSLNGPKVREILSGTSRVFEIRYAGYNDILVAGSAADRLRTAGLFTDFEWTWTRSREGEPVPDEVAAINGKRLSLSHGPIARLEDKVQFLTARRMGSEFYVNSDHGRWIISLHSA